MTEQVLNQGTREYKNLEIAADIMTAMSSDDCYYRVRECYFDYGQDWMWTTIIKYDPNKTGILTTCQAINSRDWKLIVAADTKQDLLEIMKNIIK